MSETRISRSYGGHDSCGLVHCDPSHVGPDQLDLTDMDADTDLDGVSSAQRRSAAAQ